MIEGVTAGVICEEESEDVEELEELEEEEVLLLIGKKLV
jgi:hypothetical protein